MAECAEWHAPSMMSALSWLGSRESAPFEAPSGFWQNGFMGLLDFDQDAIKNELARILSAMPISQLIGPDRQKVTMNRLAEALRYMPQPFNRSPEAMARAQNEAMAAWSPAGLLGKIVDIKPPAWNKTHGQSMPVGIAPTKSELKELASFEAKKSGHRDVRILKPSSEGGELYAWPASSALHQDIGAYFKLRPEDYLRQEWDLSRF